MPFWSYPLSLVSFFQSTPPHTHTQAWMNMSGRMWHEGSMMTLSCYESTRKCSTFAWSREMTKILYFEIRMLKVNHVFSICINLFLFYSKITKTLSVIRLTGCHCLAGFTLQDWLVTEVGRRQSFYRTQLSSPISTQFLKMREPHSYSTCQRPTGMGIFSLGFEIKRAGNAAIYVSKTHWSCQK